MFSRKSPYDVIKGCAHMKYIIIAAPYKGSWKRNRTG